MEVYSQYFRRLLNSNAAHVFSGAAPATESSASTYGLLVNEIQKLTTDEQQPAKIAAALDSNDTDIFKDFDLAKFVHHFKLDPLATVALSLACKSAAKSDLALKGMHVLHSLTSLSMH